MSDTPETTPARLHRLIYYGRQRFAAGTSGAEQVDDIIRASIRNNRDVAISGLLLAHQGWFLQVLEGPRAAVAATYARISGDPRHDAPRALSEGAAAHREFAEWYMCARRLSAADDAILDAIGQRQSFEPHRLSGRSALRLLKAVRGLQTRPASASLG